MKHCLGCREPITRQANYCKACGYKHRTRPRGLVYKIKVKNRGWFKFVGGTVDEKGYVRFHTKDGHIREHVWVMVQSLGRKLLSHEVVHHKDGNKFNNDIKNLVLMTKKEHDNLHLGRAII